MIAIQIKAINGFLNILCAPNFFVYRNDVCMTHIIVVSYWVVCYPNTNVCPSSSFFPFHEVWHHSSRAVSRRTVGCLHQVHPDMIPGLQRHDCPILNKCCHSFMMCESSGIIRGWWNKSASSFILFTKWRPLQSKRYAKKNHYYPTVKAFNL